MSNIYNTALKSSKEFNCIDRNTLDNTNFFKNEKGIIFYFNLCDELTDEVLDMFRKCDCIYSEIAWESGFKVFHDKAEEKQKGSYKEYINNIKKIITILNKPSFIVCSKRTANFLSDKVVEIKLNGNKAHLAINNFENYSNDIENTNDLLEILSQDYNSCLDFCCGYGNAIEGFKYFVACDIDKKCLDFIKRRMENGNN